MLLNLAFNSLSPLNSLYGVFITSWFCHERIYQSIKSFYTFEVLFTSCSYIGQLYASLLGAETQVGLTGLFSGQIRLLTFASILWDGSKGESFPRRGLHLNRSVWVNEKSCRGGKKRPKLHFFLKLENRALIIKTYCKHVFTKEKAADLYRPMSEVLLCMF